MSPGVQIKLENNYTLKKIVVPQHTNRVKTDLTFAWCRPSVSRIHVSASSREYHRNRFPAFVELSPPRPDACSSWFHNARAFSRGSRPSPPLRDSLAAGLACTAHLRWTLSPCVAAQGRRCDVATAYPMLLRRWHSLEDGDCCLLGRRQ